MSNQLENSLKKITDGLNELIPDVKNFLEQAKNNLETKEEKAKFAQKLESSGLLNELDKAAQQFKEASK